MNILMSSASFLTEGAGYTITFADVMASVITIVLGVLTFFIKSWFNGVNQSNEQLKKMVKENDDAINRRIDRLEEKHEKMINDLQEEVTAVEKDFPVVYVQRDDFFRSMNSVENKMNNIDGKIDRLLMQIQNNKS